MISEVNLEYIFWSHTISVDSLWWLRYGYSQMEVNGWLLKASS